MRSPRPSRSILAEPKPRPFPTRGVPGGWHDPWDADPYDGVLTALRQQRPVRRLIEASVQIELLAQPRADGRWEAHVTSSDDPPARWPSVNAPTAALALDALEAELRELLSQGIP
jgi:hypothetical protein